MKNIRIFYLKIFIYWVVKFSVYLNRHVFEMLSDFLCALLHAKSLLERGLLLKETKLLPLGANSFFLKYHVATCSEVFDLQMCFVVVVVVFCFLLFFCCCFFVVVVVLFCFVFLFVCFFLFVFFCLLLFFCCCCFFVCFFFCFFFCRFFFNYVSFRYVQLRLGNRVATFL